MSIVNNSLLEFLSQTGINEWLSPKEVGDMIKKQDPDLWIKYVEGAKTYNEEGKAKPNHVVTPYLVLRADLEELKEEGKVEYSSFPYGYRLKCQ
ncbi:MAG: hypothetical protein AABX59_00560 [Nanoarchaeota archaeon]